MKIIGSKYYGGKGHPGLGEKLTWYVHSIKGNRAVLNEDENHEYAIMSPVKATDLVLVTAVADSYTVHSVIEGDTLWAISNRYLGSGSLSGNYDAEWTYKYCHQYRSKRN